MLNKKILKSCIYNKIDLKKKFKDLRAFEKDVRIKNQSLEEFQAGE